MTILAEPETKAAGPAVPAAPVAPAPRVVSVRQLVAGPIACVVVLLLCLVVLEGPVAHLWYNARQQQRTTGFSQRRPSTAIGQTLAILYIPSIHLKVPVVQGDSVDLLRGGPGHDPATPVPGAVGDSVLYGHREGWGGPFSKLNQLQTGADVFVELHAASQTLVFTVVSLTKVPGGAAMPRAPSDDRRLSLITGNGGRLSGGYLVVSAVSGPAAVATASSRRLPGAPQTGSPVLNRTVGSFLLRVLAGVGVALLLRRRYRIGVVVALAGPLFLAALLALLLEIDRLLPILG